MSDPLKEIPKGNWIPIKEHTVNVEALPQQKALLLKLKALLESQLAETRKQSEDLQIKLAKVMKGEIK